MSQTRVINGPHIRTERTTRNVMMNVSISLVPALLARFTFLGSELYIWQGFPLRYVFLQNFSGRN